MSAMLVGLPVLRNAVRQIATTEDALAIARQNARMALAFIILSPHTKFINAFWLINTCVRWRHWCRLCSC